MGGGAEVTGRDVPILPGQGQAALFPECLHAFTTESFSHPAPTLGAYFTSQASLTCLK